MDMIQQGALGTPNGLLIYKTEGKVEDLSLLLDSHQKVISEMTMSTGIAHT